MSVKEMSNEDKAEFLIAVRNYKFEGKEKWSKGLDFKVSDETSGENVLLRLVDPNKKSGYIGADDVKAMVANMKRKDCELGILIGRRFTDAAKEEMTEGNIQQVSEDYMPPVTSENMILTINDCIDSICTTKCGKIPMQKSDCTGDLNTGICKVRTISDDVSFHSERGWTNLVKNDLRQLLLMNKIAKAS
jgi:hypothetical protein